MGMGLQMWAKFCDLYYETRYFICSCKRNDLKLKRNLKLKRESIYSGTF